MTENHEGFLDKGAADETVERQQVDYFGFAVDERYTFPDGISYIDFKAMNEGAKAKFQKATSRDLIIERNSGNARTSVDPATERHILISESVTGWNLKRGGREIPFNRQQLTDFLTLADPKIVEGLETAIRKANPWMLADMKSEDIQREIDNLTEMLKTAQEREAGEASSASR